MPVVIDKAMQWKEMTMRAKWLWTSWAYLTAVGVIALEVMWIAFATTFLVPRFQVLMRDGLLDRAVLRESPVSWMPSFLNGVKDAGEYTIWIVLLVAVGWGLFEWRVRSANKPFITLARLGTAPGGLVAGAAPSAGPAVASVRTGHHPLAAPA